MKRLFLASSTSASAKAIFNEIGQKNLRLSYITTASELEKDQERINQRKELLKGAGFTVNEFTFTGKKTEEIKKELDGSDAILVGGGNTFYLLDKIRKAGAQDLIIKFVESGKIYIGSSAGAVLAGPDITSASYQDDIKAASNLKDYKGLNLVDFVVVPHFGSDIQKVSYEELEHSYTNEHKTILLTDYQYIKVEDNMYKIEEVPHK